MTRARGVTSASPCYFALFRGALLTLALTSSVMTTADFSVDQIRQHCDSFLTLEQYQELLELSDLSTFESYLEAPHRTRRVAENFAEAGDCRGIFSSMYVINTNELTRSTTAGKYAHQHLAEQLICGFAKCCLGPLHDVLTGVEHELQEPKWVEYYDLT